MEVDSCDAGPLLGTHRPYPAAHAVHRHFVKITPKITPGWVPGVGYGRAMTLSRAVPILTVGDLRAAVACYRAVLGVDVLMDHGWIVTLGSAGGGAQFSLMEADETAPVTPTASLQVDDVDRAHGEAVRAGLQIVHPLTDEPWGVRRFFLRDASGNVVNVLAHAA